MKASYLKASCILLPLVLTMGFVAGGCKKETPPPQKPAASAISTQDRTTTKEPTAPTAPARLPNAEFPWVIIQLIL